jgi:hypothetical protein
MYTFAVAPFNFFNCAMVSLIRCNAAPFSRFTVSLGGVGMWKIADANFSAAFWLNPIEVAAFTYAARPVSRAALAASCPFPSASFDFATSFDAFAMSSSFAALSRPFSVFSSRVRPFVFTAAVASSIAAWNAREAARASSCPPSRPSIASWRSFTDAVPEAAAAPNVPRAFVCASVASCACRIAVATPPRPVAADRRFWSVIACPEERRRSSICAR